MRKRKRTASNLMRKRKEVKKTLNLVRKKGRASVREKFETLCERGNKQFQISCEREKNSKPRANRGTEHQFVKNLKSRAKEERNSFESRAKEKKSQENSKPRAKEGQSISS